LQGTTFVIKISLIKFSVHIAKISARDGGGGGVTNLFIRARVEPPELEVTVSTGGRGEDRDAGLRTLLTPSICHHFNSAELKLFINSITSVSDPDPPDPHVFGPPGSGYRSISQKYGSGSCSGSGNGSFYH
jgi:hypothetical protein